MGHFCPPGSGSGLDPDPQLVFTYIDLGNLARVQELHLLVFILVFEEERLPVLQSARPARLEKIYLKNPFFLYDSFSICVHTARMYSTPFIVVDCRTRNGFLILDYQTRHILFSTIKPMISILLCRGRYLDTVHVQRFVTIPELLQRRWATRKMLHAGS